MKTLIIIAGFALVVGAAAFSTVFVGTETVVKNERGETVVEVLTVEVLEERIRVAQEAARSEVEKKAQAAYDAVVEDEMTAIADGVKKAYISEIEATISSEDY
jgi:hypothetical protein